MTRLYSDAYGATHFVDEPLQWSATPGDPSNSTTQRRPSSNVRFWHNASGFDADWHPTGQRQVVLVLAGALEVEASDGETREFKPGSVLLVEDTTGKGHRSHSSGDVELLLALVGAPENQE